MRAKPIVTAVLLLFVATSVAYLITKEITGTKPPLTASEKHSDSQASNKLSSGRTKGDDKIIVYYFHGTKRCHTCKTIEAYAEEAVRSAFADELASGELEWHAVNVDEPENAHFIDDYRLATRSVVLVEVKDGAEKRWENLDKVWQLVRTKPAFMDYIIDNTNEFLSGADL